MGRGFIGYRRIARCGVGVVCLAVLGGCPGDADPPSASAAPSVAPGTWVVMGSSTAAGAGAAAGAGWAERLQSGVAGRGVAVVNIAKGGATSYAGLALATAAVPGRPAPDAEANVDAALAHGPRLLLVSYPSNDTALGYTAAETVHNLLAIRAAAQAHGAAVVMLSTQPRALTAPQLAVLEQIDASLDAAVSPCFVAVREALAAADGVLDARYDSGDGVHPNDAGHGVIHDKLRELLDSQRCVRAAAS